MKWIRVENYEQMSELAAERLFAVVAAKAGNRVNLGLATGNTMLGLYKELAQRLNQAQVDLAQLHTYNLDEYVDDSGNAVAPEHPLSYRRYMQHNLFRRFDPRLGFGPAQAHFPDPWAPAQYDADIAAGGGLDLQLLGLGFNGHIAFNEPQPETEIAPAAFAALPTRLVTLDALTIDTNARLTAGGDHSRVPRRAVSQGMKPILESHEILLLACFAEQTAALQRLRSGRITPELPASFLLQHANATVVYTADKIPL